MERVQTVVLGAGVTCLDSPSISFRSHEPSAVASASAKTDRWTDQLGFGGIVLLSDSKDQRPTHPNDGSPGNDLLWSFDVAGYSSR